MSTAADERDLSPVETAVLDQLRSERASGEGHPDKRDTETLDALPVKNGGGHLQAVVIGVGDESAILSAMHNPSVDDCWLAASVDSFDSLEARR